MSVVAVRRVVVALVVGTALSSTSRRAEADEREPAATTEQGPSQLRVSTSAMMTFGSFVGLPVVRGGLGIEGRTRYISGHALLALGRTPNGLGAHRIEAGANLTSPMGWLRASIGPHVGYAMLVRMTETDAFVNALLGDIASFSVGAHAAIELCMPITDRARAFVAARAMGEIYRRGNGWEIGPTIGVHF